MKKIFTLFAAFCFAIAANASLITWNISNSPTLPAFPTIDVGVQDGDVYDPENNSNGGITITASTTDEYQNFWLYDDYISFGNDSESGYGTFTFTSAVGNIARIEILANAEYDDKPNFSGSIMGDEWQIEYTDYHEIQKIAVWEGTPASSVDLSSVDLEINGIISISFVIVPQDFELDLRQDLFSGQQYAWMDIDGSDITFETSEPLRYDAKFVSNGLNGDARHGYVNLKADIPVSAGNYKITLGTCQYGTGTATVKDENNANLATCNQNTGACYHENTTDNVVSMTFSVASAQTIFLTCGNYTPYIKFEKLSSVEYTISFAAEGAEGILPSPVNVPEGESFTIPTNNTLYKEGYTLTGWNDGVETHLIGSSLIPTDNIVLTAVFTENTVDLLSATSECTVYWEFRTGSGAPTVNFEGNTGFLVSQAIISGTPIDVKLTIDATAGKFSNRNSADWCQVNQNTALSFPSKVGATVQTFTMAEPTGSTVDGNTYSDYASYITTYTVTGASGSSELINGSGTVWYRYLQVVYPASDPTAIGQTDINAKAAKVLRNGMLVIEKNGKFYNALGAKVK